MSWFKKGLTRKVIWHPEPTDMAYRWPDENLATYSQLIVNESQQAVLFKDGEMIKSYGPGRHSLDSRNLPLTDELNSFPYGSNPFTAEIYFVNRIDFKAVKFATDMFRYHDPDYRTMLPLVARGNCGIKITDGGKFIKKMLGTRRKYTVGDLTSSLKAELSTDVSSLISGCMQQNTIGVKAVSSYLANFSRTLQPALEPVFSNYGLQLISFHISAVDVDESRPDGREIVKALTAQTTQSIAGYSWQQKQAFELADKQLDVAENVLKSDSDMGVFGAMMMSINGRGSFGNMMNNPELMRRQADAPGSIKSAGQLCADEQVFCSKCARKYPASAKFCPYCGDIYNACPNCGYDNHLKAAKCVRCGISLLDDSGGICPKCQQPIMAGADFCPNCGEKLPKECSRCHSQIKSGQDFCPVCGKRVSQ